MSKKVNKKTVINRVNNAIDTTKKAASKTNDFALNTTEEVVLGTINVAGEWQKVQDKALKGGLKLMANQQDLMFNALEMLKGQLLQGKKRMNKIFA